MPLWVSAMWDRGTFLSDILIQEKARRVQDAITASIPEGEQYTTRFSNGWLYSFKQRKKLKAFRSHAEAGDADHEASVAALPRTASQCFYAQI